jgi:hypothetical protein
MRRLNLILPVLCMVMIITAGSAIPSQVSHSDDIGDRSENDAGSVSYQASGRGTGTFPRTSLYLATDDDTWVGQLDHLEDVDGKYIRLKEKELGYTNEITSSGASTYHDLGSRSVQGYDDMIFLAHITSDSGTYHFWLSVSSDHGETWIEEEVWSQTGISQTGTELLVYQDKIFYLSKFLSPSLNVKISHIRVTSYMNWKNISSVGTKEIIPTNDMDLPRCLVSTARYF